MNDKQRVARLKAAKVHLTQTTRGYNPTGPHWGPALQNINLVIADLSPITIPSLGKLYASGRSVLLEDLTHATSSIDFYPALDTAFRAGTNILAVEDLIVIEPDSGSNPGEAFYARGESKLKYWYGHLAHDAEPGRRFKKGDVVGTVLFQRRADGTVNSHLHWGINVEEFIGRRRIQLLYGATGHGPNYTRGSATIGKQLTDLLAA